MHLLDTEEINAVEHQGPCAICLWAETLLSRRPSAFTVFEILVASE